MPKLLNNREAALLRLLAAVAERLDNAQPDVGFTTRETVLRRWLKHLPFEIDDDDIAEACEDVGGS